MDITYQGQQLIFYFDVFVELVRDILHCSMHIQELILFHVVIYFMCLVRFLFIMFNKHHLSLVHCCYFVLCMCTHVYLKLLLCEDYHFGCIMFIAYAMFVCINMYFISLERWPYVCRARQDHVFKTSDESFRFHNKNFDEMRCKLDSTENPRSFEKYQSNLRAG